MVPLKGGTMVVTGTDFGEERHSPSADIAVAVVNSQNGFEIGCSNAIRVSGSLIECSFRVESKLDDGGSPSFDNATVSVAGLRSNSVRVHHAGLDGIPSGPLLSSEGAQVNYSIRLMERPHEMVQVTVVTDDDARCQVSSAHVVEFYPSAYATPASISIRLSDNFRDEGPEAVAFECAVRHTVNSTDTVYGSMLPRILTLQAINDDVSDAKLLLTDTHGSFSTVNDGFRLKLAQLVVSENSADAYGVGLDTQPLNGANVTVTLAVIRPRDDSPVRIALSVNELVFKSESWNVPQIVHVNVSNDDVDNAFDVEDFAVLHKIHSDGDPLFTSTELTTIVHVIDDDTAAVLI